MFLEVSSDFEPVQVTCWIFTHSNCIDKSSKISCWWWISHVFLSRYDEQIIFR